MGNNIIGNKNKKRDNYNTSPREESLVDYQKDRRRKRMDKEEYKKWLKEVREGLDD